MTMQAFRRLEPARREAGLPPPSSGNAAQRKRRLAMCSQMLAREEIIERIMGSHITPDAELGMLLYIYSTEQTGREPYLWEVCTATSVPLSTAHRKLTTLTGEGIIVRSPMMADRRRIGLLLTPVARELIETLLDRLIDQG